MVVISTLNLGKHSEEVIQVDTDILSIGFQNLKNIKICRPLPQIFGGTSRSGRKVSLKNWKKIIFGDLRRKYQLLIFGNIRKKGYGHGINWTSKFGTSRNGRKIFIYIMMSNK